MNGSTATNSALTGNYGTLTVSSTGGYTYVPDAVAINEQRRGLQAHVHEFAIFVAANRLHHRHAVVVNGLTQSSIRPFGQERSSASAPRTA